MKNLTQKQQQTIRKSFIFLIASCVALIGINVFAKSNIKDFKNHETYLEAEKENTRMTQDLIFAIYGDGYEIETEIAEAEMVLVYDENDSIIYESSLESWTNGLDTETSIIKRNAELLFESDGTTIYKVFN